MLNINLCRKSTLWLWRQFLHSRPSNECNYDSSIKPLIGLEVHAQLKTKAKVFSHGSNRFSAQPNSQLDLIDIATPGSLPQLNASSVSAAILTSLALNCKVKNEFHFDRKNYFYPDMPAGFQITQSSKPIAVDGYLEFLVLQEHKARIPLSMSYGVYSILYKNNSETKADSTQYKVSKIKQVQLEQDSAKMFHEHDETNGEFCLIDYNRCGSDLIEIVFEPDIESPVEAASLVRELILLLKSLDTCDCELQEGSLRVDANVSVRKENESIENVGRVELKNLNSLKNIKLALQYEIERQTNIVNASGVVQRETRVYDPKAAKTVVLRAKEKDTDYRIVPEPSIPPVSLSDGYLDDIKSLLSTKRVTSQLRKELKKYQLSPETTINLIERPDLLDVFLKVAPNFNSTDSFFKPETLADFLLYVKINLKKLPVEGRDDHEILDPSIVLSIMKLIDEHKISLDIAYELFKLYYTQNVQETPAALVEKFGWNLIDDDEQILQICKMQRKISSTLCKKYKTTGDIKYLRSILERLSNQYPRLSLHKCLGCFKKILLE